MPNLKILPPEPPSYMARMPKSARRHLDVDTVLMDALTATNHPTKYAALVAYHRLESTVAAAKRQRRRIAQGKRTLAKQLDARKHPGPLRALAGLFHDVDFYVVCRARIAKLSKFLSQRTRFQRLGRVLRRYRSELDQMIRARDHLEHFEERLPGGSRRNKLRNPSDLFNIAGDHMTFGGERFDVGPTNLSMLTDFVSELRAALLYDALDVLAAIDQGLLVRRVQEAYRDAALPRLMKRAQVAFLAATRQSASG